MWIDPPAVRLKQWLEFRSQLNKFPLLEALQKTAHLWSFAPFVGKYLSPDDITNWPDPWALLSKNHYCDLAKCLGMLYTICLTNKHNTNSFSLQIRTDESKGSEFNIVVVNNQYVLNYIFDEVVNIDDLKSNSIIRYEYSNDDLGIDNY